METKATFAVVQAKWSCGKLQKLAQSFQSGRIERSEAEEDLNKLRRDAKIARDRESVQLMQYQSGFFDWADGDWVGAAKCTQMVRLDWITEDNFISFVPVEATSWRIYIHVSKFIDHAASYIEIEPKNSTAIL